MRKIEETISKYPAFVFGMVTAVILGLVEGSALAYMFSGETIYLELVGGFGLLLVSSLFSLYTLYRRASPQTSH